MKTEVHISRHGFKIDIQYWKELISALVLVGYEVYADEDKLVFTLGHDDQVVVKKEES